MLKDGDAIYYYLSAGEKYTDPRKELKISVIKETIEVVKPPVSSKISIWIFILGGSIVLIFLIIVIYLKFIKKKKPNPADIPPEKNVFSIVEDEEKVDFYVGLNGVRNDIKNYYLIDARHIFSDTAINEIFISRDAIKSLYDKFKVFLENPERTFETGCYLVGRWEYSDVNKTCYNISLEYIVEPGDDIIYGEYALNFGFKIGVILGSTLRNLSEKTNCDYVHTCWMHSHPGLGLFLSSQDLIVQKKLAYSDAKNRMLAIVIDTNTSTWETAFFTPQKDGNMNNKDDMKKTYSFDLLYQWSRKSKEETIVINPVSIENYFPLEIKNSNILSILFGAKTINDIDDILYSNNKGIIGFFSGITQATVGNKQNLLIEKCSPSSENNVLGCLISEPLLSYSEILLKYKEALAKHQFFIIHKTDSELYVSIKNPEASFTEDQNSLSHFSLDQMKEWTRRRRK